MDKSMKHWHKIKERKKTSFAGFILIFAGLGAYLLFTGHAATPGPTNIAVAIVSGAAKEGQELAVSQGVWDNTSNAPSTFSYQWQRCSGGSCINIPWAV